MAKPKYMPTGYQPFSQQSNQYQQSEMLRSKVCGYLKKKIADEEQETQQYATVEQDVYKIVDKVSAPQFALHKLNTSQSEELQALKTIYSNVCVRY